LGTSQEAILVAELGNRYEVPILSMVNEVPVWASLRWPFLINAARNQLSQMKAIAAIVQSWQWRRVNVIYEENKVNSIIPHLFAALQDADAEISELLPFPPSPPYRFLSEKLVSLRNGQCRVFIVHTSATLARSIFREAKKLEMMEEEYVWITTDSTSDYFDTFNNSVLSSMQGALGVKSYISSSSKRIKDFRSRFQVMFSSQFPEEPFPEPGISALQAYDATWAVALAMEGRPSSKRFGNSTSITPKASMGGTSLLNRILASKFEGLTGHICFINGMLHPAARIFTLVNVVGISTELGYWTEGYGFSKTVGANIHYNKSITVLRQIIWPGGPWSAPRGWASAAGGKRLKIVVPSGNSHKEFVKVSYDGPGGSIRVTGFVIDVFNATLSRLPYALPCDFTGYDGSYDALVYQVYNRVTIVFNILSSCKLPYITLLRENL
jgi:ionotropic glutamate receptor NMDA 1/ionotropic glutamate receptor